jgi:hypothetical protein
LPWLPSSSANVTTSRLLLSTAQFACAPSRFCSHALPVVIGQVPMSWQMLGVTKEIVGRLA